MQNELVSFSKMEELQNHLWGVLKMNSGLCSYKDYGMDRCNCSRWALEYECSSSQHLSQIQSSICVLQNLTRSVNGDANWSNLVMTSWVPCTEHAAFAFATISYSFLSANLQENRLKEVVPCPCLTGCQGANGHHWGFPGSFPPDFVPF